MALTPTWLSPPAWLLSDVVSPNPPDVQLVSGVSVAVLATVVCMHAQVMLRAPALLATAPAVSVSVDPEVATAFPPAPACRGVAGSHPVNSSIDAIIFEAPALEKLGAASPPEAILYQSRTLALPLDTSLSTPIQDGSLQVIAAVPKA